MHFTCAFREAIGSLREGCGDLHPFQLTQGWSRYLERRVLHAVHASSSDAMRMIKMVADAFQLGWSQLDAGTSGPEAFENIVQVLSRGLSRVTPGAVIQVLQKPSSTVARLLPPTCQN